MVKNIKIITRFQTSESDVNRRQILTSKVDLCATLPVFIPQMKLHNFIKLYLIKGICYFLQSVPCSGKSVNDLHFSHYSLLERDDWMTTASMNISVFLFCVDATLMKPCFCRRCFLLIETIKMIYCKCHAYACSLLSFTIIIIMLVTVSMTLKQIIFSTIYMFIFKMDTVSSRRTNEILRINNWVDLDLKYIHNSFQD